MDTLPRHQCLLYEGSPAKHLAAVAAVLSNKLKQNYRCLYLDCRPKIESLRSYLTTAGIDVLEAIAEGSLILSAERGYLSEGKFDIERMMQSLRSSLKEARYAGYEGLWASGDITWELGPEKDFSRLLHYEWRLEAFIAEHPDFSGICQYQAGTLPCENVRQGFVSHQSIFVNEKHSFINPHYLPASLFTQQASSSPAIESALRGLLRPQDQG